MEDIPERMRRFERFRDLYEEEIKKAFPALVADLQKSMDVAKAKIEEQILAPTSCGCLSPNRVDCGKKREMGTYCRCQRCHPVEEI